MHRLYLPPVCQWLTSLTPLLAREGEPVLGEPVSGTWSVHPTLGESPAPRVNATLALDHTRLLLFGGYCLDTAACLAELWVLSLLDDVWTCPETPGMPPGRVGHSAVLLENSMIVFGGLSGTRFLNDAHALDLATLTWWESGRTSMLGDSHTDAKEESKKKGWK